MNYLKNLKDAKKIYDNIEIPNELKQIVENTIKYEEKVIDMKDFKRKKHYGKYVAAAAATAFMCMTVGLNTSEAFASNVGQIPIIGEIAKVLTVRTYDKSDKDKTLTAEVPEVQSDTNFAKKVNEEIQKIVEKHIKESEKRIEEYKTAFLETGGKEEEFSEKNIKANVTYDIKYQSNDLVSFVITSTEDWANAYTEQYFYNLDLKKNIKLTLEDILGEDYIQITNTSIFKQMKERTEQDASVSYFDANMDGFTTIDENTKFYINENENPVIVFDRYEIAPGSMGIQEFEIQK